MSTRTRTSSFIRASAKNKLATSPGNFKRSKEGQSGDGSGDDDEVASVAAPTGIHIHTRARVHIDV